LDIPCSGKIQLEVDEHDQQNMPLSAKKIIVSHEVRVPVNEHRTKKNPGLISHHELSFLTVGQCGRWGWCGRCGVHISGPVRPVWPVH